MVRRFPPGFTPGSHPLENDGIPVPHEETVACMRSAAWIVSSSPVVEGAEHTDVSAVVDVVQESPDCLWRE